MSGEDVFRPTRRDRPVNVIPDAEADRHIPGGHCPCLPLLEKWTYRGQTTHRLMHRELPATGEPGGTA